MKPDLIILHGALGSKAQFKNLINQLDSDYTIHTFDFVGHGSEPAKSSFGISTFANQLDEYILTNQLNKPLIFGYSMGGYVALYLEGQKQGSLGKVFTLATKFDWNPESSKKEAGYLNIEVMTEKVPRYVDYLKNLHGDQWEGTITQTREMMLRMGSSPELNTDVLRKIDIDCLITVGELDRMVSQDETKQLSESIRNARFKTWPATEHPIEKVDIEMISDEIKSFLKN